MFVRIAKSACLLGTAAASLLLANSSAEALTCPKCYCQPRLCNWATYGYYPTEWRPWPEAIGPAHAPAPYIIESAPHVIEPAPRPMVNPSAPSPLTSYRMMPTRPGDLRQGAEQLKMPLPVKPK